jgi:PIN like domain
VRFFLDNTLPPRFAEVLQLLEGDGGHKIVHLRSKFPVDTKDVDWIRSLAGERDWVIVSGDIRISQNEFERKEWLNSKLTAFFFAKGWTTIKLWDQAWRLIKWWPAIVEQSQKIRPGAGFVVPLKSAKLEQLKV